MNAFIGEIRAFGFGFCPEGWFSCDGQKLGIQQYTVLYAVVKDYYGTCDKDHFRLPNLNGRTPMGVHDLYPLGATGGAETVKLSADQLPSHNHVVQAFKPDPTQRNFLTNQPGPDAYLSYGFSKETPIGVSCYSDDEKEGSYLNSGTLDNFTPNGQPHENRMPYQVMNYCICFDGVFPAHG